MASQAYIEQEVTSARAGPVIQRLAKAHTIIILFVWFDIPTLTFIFKINIHCTICFYFYVMNIYVVATSFDRAQLINGYSA